MIGEKGLTLSLKGVPMLNTLITLGIGFVLGKVLTIARLKALWAAIKGN